MAEQRPECWTITAVAEHLGISENAARGQLSRWRIRGVTHYPAESVQRAHAGRRGSGNWGPRTKNTTGLNPEETTMTTIAVPDWADYIVNLGAQGASYLEATGRHLGGLRIVDLGGGRAALDEDAVQALMRQPEDADGCITKDASRLTMWIGGVDYDLEPVAGI